MPIRDSTAANRSALSASELANPENREPDLGRAATWVVAAASCFAKSFSLFCIAISCSFCCSLLRLACSFNARAACSASSSNGDGTPPAKT